MTSKSGAMCFLSHSFLARAALAKKIGIDACSREHKYILPTATRLRHIVTSHLQYINGTATTREKRPARVESRFFLPWLYTHCTPYFLQLGASPTNPGTVFSPKIQTTNRSSAPGLSDISLHHVLPLAAHATPHASRARASGCKTLANKPTEEQKQWTAPSSKQKFSVAADRS